MHFCRSPFLFHPCFLPYKFNGPTSLGPLSSCPRADHRSGRHGELLPFLTSPLPIASSMARDDPEAHDFVDRSGTSYSGDHHHPTRPVNAGKVESDLAEALCVPASLLVSFTPELMRQIQTGKKHAQPRKQRRKQSMCEDAWSIHGTTSLLLPFGPVLESCRCYRTRFRRSSR